MAITLLGLCSIIVGTIAVYDSATRLWKIHKSRQAVITETIFDHNNPDHLKLYNSVKPYQRSWRDGQVIIREPLHAVKAEIRASLKSR